MSQVQLKTRRSRFEQRGQTSVRQQAENVLREAAFVLEMTRQVKDAILNNKALLHEDRSEKDISCFEGAVS